VKTITSEFVDELIDFSPGEAKEAQGVSELQREGTVAAFNMLATNRCAYLADEVGTGKTYIALGVMSLLRFLKPDARVIVIAPRENIQRKWEKELRNFVRVNWRVVGNRVKSLQGSPVWEPKLCHSLVEFANESMINHDRDFLLRMTSFSVGLSDPERREARRKQLFRQIPWMRKGGVSNRSREVFRDTYAMALNGAVPDADLVIFDEAHNLKHGFSERGSIRNRVMGLAFGHPDAPKSRPSWYAPRAKRVLFLSATPFEDDYGAIQRQFDIFGFGGAAICDASGADPQSMRLLVDPDESDERKRALIERLLIRRVSGLNIANELHTKNMYRREWRSGGLRVHDEPIFIEDPKQRLIVALMQKKVAEVLQSERFNNSFQIGMLSSFESFIETMSRTRRLSSLSESSDEESDGAFDDADQNLRASSRERRGIDTDAISQVSQSYRERFGGSLPHPKLDAVADAHASAFETGEKTLIFVRRVATVAELSAKLEAASDRWMRHRMDAVLPELSNEISDLFVRYERERSRRPDEIAAERHGSADEDVDDVDDERRLIFEPDEGGAETFFAWFFRGAGPPGILSGGAFQRNRLSSTSSVYASLFEDDYVAVLIKSENRDVGISLAAALGISESMCVDSLRELAFGHFASRSRQREGYPRSYVVESYQVAGLTLLARHGGVIGEQAVTILEERFNNAHPEPITAPPGFPEPTQGIGFVSVFTELRKRPALCEVLWPKADTDSFREGFRMREQRRELLSAMARLGATYIDLYLLAIRALGSFSPGRVSEDSAPAERLACEFVEMLDRQQHEPGFHAYRELSLAAGAFKHIVAVNFPGVPDAELPELARIYAATLQKQLPVGRMAGGVNKRVVGQFRMPGFPLVLVSTDVLQEGEDLHTFCRRVVHYGIAWTPSAMEQRTGRVDRIGGLVQRELDGTSTPPSDDQLIQVFYPHLQDTVEVLQVRRVMKRLNRFLELMHRQTQMDERQESSIDVGRAWLEEYEQLQPPKGRLESAFPVQAQWLEGTAGKDEVVKPDWVSLFEHFDALWTNMLADGAFDDHTSTQARIRTGAIRMDASGSKIGHRAQSDGEVSRTQDFRLELRSQIAGDETLLWCTSEVGLVDLANGDEIDALIAAQQALGWVKVCVSPRVTKDADELFVEGDILFHPDATQHNELRALAERTANAAVLLRVRGVALRQKRGPRRGTEELESRVDELIKKRRLPWRRQGHELWVELSEGIRRQRISVHRVGSDYVFASRVVPAEFLRGSRKRRRDLAFTIWRRNALTPVVAFAFDRGDRLVGVVEQPADSMQDDELQFYVESLARECDRLEFILMGADVA
jgi:hypothetical protein